MTSMLVQFCCSLGRALLQEAGCLAQRMQVESLRCLDTNRQERSEQVTPTDVVASNTKNRDSLTAVD